MEAIAPVELNEKTRVPLRLVIALFALVGTLGPGALIYIVTMSADLAQARLDIKENHNEISIHRKELEDIRMQQLSTLNRIDHRLLRMENKMGVSSRQSEED